MKVAPHWFRLESRRRAHEEAERWGLWRHAMMANIPVDKWDGDVAIFVETLKKAGSPLDENLAAELPECVRSFQSAQQRRAELRERFPNPLSTKETEKVRRKRTWDYLHARMNEIDREYAEERRKRVNKLLAPPPALWLHDHPRCMSCHGGFNAGLVDWKQLPQAKRTAILQALNAPSPLLGYNGPFLEDFLLGQGERFRFYPANTPETQDMRNSPGATKLRNEFYANGRKDLKAGSYGTFRAAWETGPCAPTHWDKAEAQVGGFGGATVKNNGDGTATFTIINEAGLRSFSYHRLENRESDTGKMRTIYQIFQWTEKIK